MGVQEPRGEMQEVGGRRKSTDRPQACAHAPLSGLGVAGGSTTGGGPCSLMATTVVGLL